MKTEKRKIGDFGESIATKFLMKHGFAVLDRNYSKPWGEIDIICQIRNRVHFVEVKTIIADLKVIHETSDTHRPEDNLHADKIHRLHRTLYSYIDEKGIGNEWQLDLVTVIISPDYKKTKVNFIQNIV